MSGEADFLTGKQIAFSRKRDSDLQIMWSCHLPNERKMNFSVLSKEKNEFLIYTLKFQAVVKLETFLPSKA